MSALANFAPCWSGPFWNKKAARLPLDSTNKIFNWQFDFFPVLFLLLYKRRFRICNYSFRLSFVMACLFWSWKLRDSFKWGSRPRNGKQSSLLKTIPNHHSFHCSYHVSCVQRRNKKIRYTVVRIYLILGFYSPVGCNQTPLSDGWNTWQLNLITTHSKASFLSY